MTDSGTPSWLDEIRWDDQGLAPAIAWDPDTGQVLTLAWMNRAALEATVVEGRAVYWSRSRGRLWRKGEESGYLQKVLEIRLDCDRDTILLSVSQEGGIACHTGRHHCFFHKLENGTWKIVEPVLRDPREIYPGK